MIVNLRKTKEIVSHGPSARYSLPSLVTGIEQVVSAKLLGVTFSHNLTFDEHVKNILTICNCNCNSHNLPSKELHTVFCNALIVSRILYALPAWGGFLTADLNGKIDGYLCKAFDVIPAILNYCLSFCMMRIWNCLEVCCTTPTAFTSYFPHWSLCQWNSALLIALLLSTTVAIITSTNIHLSYNVFLMQHISILITCVVA